MIIEKQNLALDRAIICDCEFLFKGAVVYCKFGSCTIMLYNYLLKGMIHWFKLNVEFCYIFNNLFYYYFRKFGDIEEI